MYKQNTCIIFFLAVSAAMVQLSYAMPSVAGIGRKESNMTQLSPTTHKLLSLLSLKDKSLLPDELYKQYTHEIEQQSNFKDRMKILNGLLLEITQKEFESDRETILSRININKRGKTQIRVDTRIKKRAQKEIVLCKYLNLSYHIYVYCQERKEIHQSQTLADVLQSMERYLKRKEKVSFFSQDSVTTKRIIKNYSHAIQKLWNKQASIRYLNTADYIPFAAVNEFISQAD